MRFTLLAPALLPGLLFAQLGFLAEPIVAFHSRLARAEPAADSTVRDSPTHVRLWFSETCEVSLSSIKLVDAAGVDVPVGKASATDDPRSFTATVNRKLSPGRYQVVYKTAGHDGHAVRGQYSFTLAK